MKKIPEQRIKLGRSSKLSQRFLSVINQIKFLPSQSVYNLSICDRKKFVWFRVAKVGTRSIYHQINANGSTSELVHPYQILYSPRRYEDYFKFAFVRNPWDRIISCWRNKVVEKNAFKLDDAEFEKVKQFEYFVDYVSRLDIETCNNHLRLQCALIDLNRIDFLGRFETFEKDLRYVLGCLEISFDNILHENKSKRKNDFREYYTDSLKKKVYHIYKKDIDIFGYRFD